MNFLIWLDKGTIAQTDDVLKFLAQKRPGDEGIFIVGSKKSQRRG